ncbi:MAG: bifunctional glutamate N-acetyltransferase/amino-acid acetyltransferase ArgJ [Gammaproteobacteria bacterium]|nr:bifunctional ornithine acetyltransferase/N-acetylglutamate synthase [Gammaproteobacteria bacterium]MDP6097328.1 bifunctional glutamate N-acetyltransferase/amino-acid acetyltransferase ArgJ [Gammaproteobacteria bacterium]MDP7455780.1 bifunctional glutamate N-acetyltransferase/amino-acid acetyltransferase ArgJ [Gammaproteobacteria bacterium]HJO11617.1 bifunctional glutamate N-acetyltransferase/amino-acid acetyltransferase ArgJ [Gammaproteobacteria bacterium]
MVVGTNARRNCLPVKGIRLAAVKSQIRYPDRLDLVLIEIAEEATVAGVFTQNAFCAAPVTVAKEHLQQKGSRYFLVNTGNANAGTGTAGIAAALGCCQSVADLTNVDFVEVLPFSTGVIGESLPVDKIVAGIPDALAELSEDNWLSAAKGIMTTDTRPKIATASVEINGQQVHVSGIAKGAGMIKPNMATMLSFVFTDAAIAEVLLDQLINNVVNRSFNRITVDGDTSTNDCCMLVATGRSGIALSDSDTNTLEKFTEVLDAVFHELATGLIRDAEGASKFITLRVINGTSSKECLQVGYAVAESPLVKTAFFAADPNWGRILAAVGRSGLEDLDIDCIKIYLGDVCLVSNGGVDLNYHEARAQAVMNNEEIEVVIDLARGDCIETIWTSDLSHDYIRINAEYRT